MTHTTLSVTYRNSVNSLGYTKKNSIGCMPSVYPPRYHFLINSQIHVLIYYLYKPWQLWSAYVAFDCPCTK